MLGYFLSFVSQIELILNQNLYFRFVDIREIQNEKDMEAAFEIRRLVFVKEQHVAPEDEYDSFETESVHYLALEHGIPVGTCRFRSTDKGIKLERFAVLQSFRRNGVGEGLLLSCLNHPMLRLAGTLLYMHSQEHAIGFYEKFGFHTVGERFWECGIPHFEMEKTVIGEQQ